MSESINNHHNHHSDEGSSVNHAAAAEENAVNHATDDQTQTPTVPLDSQLSNDVIGYVVVLFAAIHPLLMNRELEQMAQSKTTGMANWRLKCCSNQPNTNLPGSVPQQAQTAIYQLRLNRLTSAASYQAAFIGRIMSPICGSGEETAEHLLLSYPRWAVECQHHLGDCILD